MPSFSKFLVAFSDFPCSEASDALCLKVPMMPLVFAQLVIEVSSNELNPCYAVFVHNSNVLSRNSIEHPQGFWSLAFDCLQTHLLSDT